MDPHFIHVHCVSRHFPEYLAMQGFNEREKERRKEGREKKTRRKEKGREGVKEWREGGKRLSFHLNPSLVNTDTVQILVLISGMLENGDNYSYQAVAEIIQPM